MPQNYVLRSHHVLSNILVIIKFHSASESTRNEKYPRYDTCQKPMKAHILLHACEHFCRADCLFRTVPRKLHNFPSASIYLWRSQNSHSTENKRNYSGGSRQSNPLTGESAERLSILTFSPRRAAARIHEPNRRTMKRFVPFPRDEEAQLLSPTHSGPGSRIAVAFSCNFSPIKDIRMKSARKNRKDLYLSKDV